MAQDTELLAEICRMIERFCQGAQCDTSLPGVTLLRSDTPTVPIPAVYEPMLCLIAQGSKRTLLGDRLFEYGAGDYVVASVDLPISGEVLEASPESPYLAFSLRLDTSVLADLLLAMSE